MLSLVNVGDHATYWCLRCSIRKWSKNCIFRYTRSRGFYGNACRGAQVTDLAIIVIAADDNIMPQTKEAISHAQAAGVPIVFAINKIDRPTANPDKIKEGLAAMNLLVEDWGGSIQSHDISAKTGQGVDELLEKVLLEAEIIGIESQSK